MKTAAQEAEGDSDDSVSHLSGSSPLLALSESRRPAKRDKIRRNIENFLNHKLRKMIQFLRTQEHQYVKLSKNISDPSSFNSTFDFMTEETPDDWDLEGREGMMVVDIRQDSGEQMKGVLEKINKLTKMLTSMSEVGL